MGEGWTRLTHPIQGSQPPILIKVSTNSAGYEVYLTDLGHVWTEKLNRREIIKRALTDDASIDPSEDAEQFQVLLQKIKDALHGSKGSKVTVNKASRGHDLELVTTTKLPAPLQPLEWRFQLSQCPQNALTRHIVLPLLREERARETQLQSLMNHLKEKDWVLGKLFDKIESAGLDLGTVFPNAGGIRSAHKGMTYAQAAKAIKGVAAFDENAWRAELGVRDQDGSSDKLSFPATDLDIDNLEAAPDNWWEHLDANNSTVKPEPSFSSTKSRQASTAQETSEGSDDEFQRQDTPPRLKQTTRDRNRPAALPADADETDAQGEAGHSETASDDEEEPPARASTASTKSSHRAKARPNNLGMIGGKKKLKEDQRARKHTPSTASGSESPPPQVTNHNADDSTESDEEDVPSPAKQPPVEKTVRPAAEDKPKKQRAGGLGMIGGGKKYKDKQPSRDPTPLPDRSRDASGDEEESRPRDTPKKQKRGGKLGVIGKKANNQPDKSSKDLPSRSSKKTTPMNDDEDDDLDDQAASKPRSSKDTSRTKELPKVETSSSPEPPPKKPPPEPEKEETAAEKANRRREELKRQLEAKEKAPTKKKRKF
ncbi:hypothetical protein FQN54_005010 [Arachnomyces sp. PD_36]|nr:hypothetical protein FQN54_005010 [Arachnomyces sp. PD_36]